jgi:hypothetical protein
MKNWTRISLCALAVAGCEAPPQSTISGTMGGSAFNSVGSAWFGGPFILLFENEMDCMDTYWAARSYMEDISPSENLDYRTLQFTFDSDAVSIGTFSVYGDAAVSTFGLSNNGPDFELYRGRDGDLTINTITSDSVTGSFSVELDDGLLSGEIYADACINLKP